jgi:hypothetical protein
MRRPAAATAAEVKAEAEEPDTAEKVAKEVPAAKQSAAKRARPSGRMPPRAEEQSNWATEMGGPPRFSDRPPPHRSVEPLCTCSWPKAWYVLGAGCGSHSPGARPHRGLEVSF